MFYPVLQPVIDTNSGDVAFYEALLRVIGQVNNTHVSVIQFAEMTGSIHEIDLIMLQLMSQWMTHNEDKIVAVNLSPHTLENHLPSIIGILESNNIADRLILEITETLPIHEMESAKNAMFKLRDHGVCFAMDDYGCGHATEDIVRQIRPEIIKFDHWAPSQEALLNESVSLANELGCIKVAEKVDNEHDVQRAKDLGINIMQGYYFSHPLKLSEFNQSELSKRKNVAGVKFYKTHDALNGELVCASM